MKKLHNMLPFRRAVCGLVGLATLAKAGGGDGLYQEYCSNENTGSDYSPVSSIYQSNGSCKTQCQDNYAFAIVQYQNCWCSNYIPASQQSMSDCNQQCPGYPDDKCGNEGQGMFGYIALTIAPSGTAGAVSSTSVPSSTSTPSTTEQPTTSSQTTTSSPSPSSSTEPATSYVSRTVYDTDTVTSKQSESPSVLVSTVTPTPSTTTSYPPTSTSTPLTSTSSPTPSTSSFPLPTPSSTTSAYTSVRVVTVSGAKVTQTVTSTPFPAPGSSSNTEPIHREGLSGGAIAGIVIGSLVGLAALALAAFLLWRRKKSSDSEAGGTSRPKRTTSVLSRTGLLGARPQSMAETTFDESNYGGNGGNNSVRHSMLFGAGAASEGISPSSPLGSSQDNLSRRHSKPLVYDQRLNPSALFANAEANGSRVSMQDQQDYSRPLGVANPDMRASFESRA